MKRLLVLGMVASMAFGAFAGAGDSKKDLDMLQGSWKVVSVKSSDSKDPADDYLKSINVAIKGDIMTVAKKSEVLVVFKIKLDAAKNPKTIDLLHDGLASDPDKGKTELGIYKIEGDTVTFCANLPGLKDRPAALATKEKTKFEVTVLKKAK